MTRPHPSILASALAMMTAAAAVAQGPAERPLLPKQVAAPPADILAGVVRAPDPAAWAPRSRYTIVPVALEPRGDGSLGWSGDIPIDDGLDVRAALVRPAGAPMDWSLRAPGPIGQAEAREFERPSERRTIDARRVTRGRDGAWRVEVVSDAAVAPGEARLIVATASPHALVVHPTTNRLVAGEAITLEASIETDARAGEAATLTEATLIVEGAGAGPIEMLDPDSDGTFEASFIAPAPGRATILVQARGVTEDGRAFVRTSEQGLPIAAGGLTIGTARSASATLRPDPAAPDRTLRIDLPVESIDAGRRLLTAAEVWDGDGPLVWAAMITEPRPGPDGEHIVSLHVDRRWLAGADAGTLELREVRLHDVASFVPIATRAAMPLEAHAGLTLPREDERAAIDGAMLVGRPRADLALAPTVDPARLDAACSAGRAFGAHNLVLSHGYCAGQNPWPSPDFAGFSEFFLDADQNRSHDQFAQLLLAFGESSKSFGVVGHSQGGNAALHLWTFYFSGLDWAEGPRLIQSVGTPYQGTPLASLGGFSCGVNDDLTPAGAANWLSTIPTASRDDVWYWTTSSDGPWCEFLANLVLSTPNDGVVEVARGQLPGANDMGNTEGWCHTTGMADPAQYTDTSRNTEMNAEAAR